MYQTDLLAEGLTKHEIVEDLLESLLKHHTPLQLLQALTTAVEATGNPQYRVLAEAASELVEMSHLQSQLHRTSQASTDRNNR